MVGTMGDCSLADAVVKSSQGRVLLGPKIRGLNRVPLKGSIRATATIRATIRI